MSDDRGLDRLWNGIKDPFHHVIDRLDRAEATLAAIAGKLAKETIMRQEIQDALTQLSTDVAAWKDAHQTQLDSDTADVVAAIQAIDATVTAPPAVAVPVGEPTTPQQATVDPATVDPATVPGGTLADLSGHGETDAPADAAVGDTAPPATSDATTTF